MKERRYKYYLDDKGNTLLSAGKGKIVSTNNILMILTADYYTGSADNGRIPSSGEMIT